MKKELVSLRTIVKDSEILNIPSVRKEVLFYLNYYSLIDAALSDAEEDSSIDKYLFSIVTYFLSIENKHYENSFNFVKNFYESYMLYDIDTVIISMFDTTSTFYDSSVESKLGGAIAVYDMLNYEGSYKEIFSLISESLQKV